MIGPQTAAHRAPGLAAYAKAIDRKAKKTLRFAVLRVFARLHTDTGLGRIEVDTSEISGAEAFLARIADLALLPFLQAGFVDLSVAVIVFSVADLGGGLADGVGGTAVTLGRDTAALDARLAAFALAIPRAKRTTAILQADQRPKTVALLAATPSLQIGRRKKASFQKEPKPEG